MLALLELNLGCGSCLDDCNTASQLGQTLLQLLAVVVAVALLNLCTNLVYATSDLLGVARTFNDGGLVLGHDDLASVTQQVQLGGVELEADFFRNDLTAGQDRDVLQHGLATVAKARSLNGDRAEGATDLVDDQGGQSLALHVLSQDDQRLAGLHDLFQNRQDVLHRADLLVRDQDVSIFEHGFHALSVGDEVRGDVTLVKTHSLGELELKTKGVALFNSDDAFLADLVHGFSDHFADLGVRSRDARSGSNLFLGLDVLGHVQQLSADSGNSLVDSTLEGHRVRTRSHVTQTFAHQGLSQNGRGRGSVTGNVVGLLGNFLDQFGTDLLEGIFEFDFLGDGDTIVGDRGGAPLLFQHNVATTWAQGDLDCVSELVHATLKTAAGLFVKGNNLGHTTGGPSENSTDETGANSAPASTHRVRVLPQVWHSPRSSANSGPPAPGDREIPYELA
ncbi:unannotated protein [freshwater metagenome]|uniref:Unannotated protein n=1 Tax=freshwater metagenome TaxID=449393 RepID=A0A6J6XGL0_9ZZZZ